MEYIIPYGLIPIPNKNLSNLCGLLPQSCVGTSLLASWQAASAPPCLAAKSSQTLDRFLFGIGISMHINQDAYTVCTVCLQKKALGIKLKNQP